MNFLQELLETETGRLRVIAFIEGVSLVLLVSLTMPLKYLNGIHWPNMVLGILHGIFFVLYVMALFRVKNAFNWRWTTTAITLILAFIPFGTLLGDSRYFEYPENHGRF